MSTDLEKLFTQALEMDEGGRRQLLADLHRSDPGGARRVRDFLDALDGAPAFLERQPEISLDDILGSAAPSESHATGESPSRLAFLKADQSVGGFRLQRVLGRGGMGVVYEAVQSTPRRRVALKLLQAADASPSTLRRFAAEAEILASLRHPSVAQVYAAGVEEIGGEPVPFLAMELVPHARTLLEYARDGDLDLEARLQLFGQAAEAVQHAHQQGVVHRDLKPANILVDPDGRVKIIDFGIARIMDGERASTAATRTGGILGTVTYMSPEQISGEWNRVDARTDVYALGVILYELVCGAPPYAVADVPLPEMVQTILHSQPIRPSVRGPVALDLETIILKALRKTRGDRYDSARALQEDLSRYLRRVPISARPPGLIYRARLATRRRPGAAAAIAVALLTVTVGASVSGWLWMRAERLQETVRDQARQTEAARSDLENVRATLGIGEEGSLGSFAPFTRGLVASVQESLGTARDDEERARLLTWAVDTLRRLEPVASGDRELRLSIAGTYMELGGLYGSEWVAGPERVKGARGAYQAAVSLLEVAARDLPDDGEVQQHLTRSRIFLSESLRKLEEGPAAVEEAERAVADAETLASQFPRDFDVSALLITALWVRGDAHITVPPRENGLRDSQRATELSHRILEMAPENPRSHDLVAWSEFRLGAWYAFTFDDPERALHHSRAATDARLALAKLAPGRREVPSSLLWDTQTEIDLLESLESPGAAAARQEEIIDVAWETAGISSQRVDLARSFAARALRLADLLATDGRLEEAHASNREMTRRLAVLDPDDAGETVPLALADLAAWTPGRETGD